MDKALSLAIKGRAVPVDIINVNKTHCLSIYLRWLWYQDHHETPEALKSALGGAGILLMVYC